MREGHHTNANGEQFWYLHDRLHRIGGPAAITCDGSEHWYFHGNRHRDDGPAYISVKLQEWWNHGNLHRTDGPAVIYEDGESADAEWWVDDEWVHSRQRYQMLTGIPDEEFSMLILKHGGFEI